MTTNKTATEFLFSYGTLQLEAVQMATFGRLLAGTSDALTGFELAKLTIEDPAVIAISGKATHTIAKFTGRDADAISGTVFRVTSDDIRHADRYEVDACKRIAVILRSGIRAWVYVDAQYVGQQPDSDGGLAEFRLSHGLSVPTSEPSITVRLLP